MATRNLRWLALALLATAPARAGAEWVAVSAAAGRTHFVDPRSITPADGMGHRWLWVKVDLTTDRRAHGSYALQRWTVRCPTGQAMLLSEAVYAEDGRLLKTSTPTPAAFADTLPGTTEQRIVAAACADEETIVVTAPSHVETVVAAMTVPVFEGEIPGARYRVIGPVSVTRKSVLARPGSISRARLYGEMWEQARAMGADAVINAAQARPHTTLFYSVKTAASGEAVKLIR